MLGLRSISGSTLSDSGVSYKLSCYKGLYSVEGQSTSFSHTSLNKIAYNIACLFGSYDVYGSFAKTEHNFSVFSPSISVDDVIDSIGSYIELFTSASIIRGNNNRTAMPDAPFVALTELRTTALNKPIEFYYDYYGVINEHNRIDVRIDFYGWELSDVARSVHTSFRTIWAVDKFPKGIVPLMCSEPRKVPIINAEDQYEQRWYMEMSLQYNPYINVPQESFNKLGYVKAIPSDVIYSAA